MPCIPIDEVAVLFSAYRNETDFCVWDALCPVLTGLDKLLIAGATPEVHARFRAFGGRLCANVVQKTGWEAKEGEDSLTKMYTSKTQPFPACYGSRMCCIGKSSP